VLTNLGWVRREESDLDRARSEFEAALRRSRRHGEAPGIGYASRGLACLAADQGDWRRAATLHGVAQAFLDRAGQPCQDLEARYRNQSLADVRAHLGDEQFDRAYAQGMTLSVDDALQCARAPGAVTTEPPAGSTSLPATSAQQRNREVLVPKNCFLYAS